MATYGATIRRGLPRSPGGEPWPPGAEAPNGVVPVAVVADRAPVAMPAPSVVERAKRDETPAAHTVRRGLPRTAGGEPWPPAGAPPVAEPTLVAERTPVAEPVEAAPAAAPSTSSGTGDVASGAGGARTLRRGLPRVPGGEPWPPASVTPDAAQVSRSAVPAAVTPHDVTPENAAVVPGATQVSEAAAAEPATPQEVTPEPRVAATDERMVRRGLPRTAGGEPWPPRGLFAARTDTAEPTPATAPAPVAEPVEALPEVAPSASSGAAGVAARTAGVAAGTGAVAAAGTPAAASVPALDVSSPLPFTRTVWEGASARSRPTPKPEAKRIGPFTRLQWAGAVIVGGAGVIYAGLMAVLAVRWLLSTEWGVDFLAMYPGEYELPAGAPVGMPPWLGWQHFFNVFLIVLIIRSGLRVRTEKRPTAFWSPRTNGRRKISLTLWFHQSLDILWIVNGVVFVVLLFTTGQWMKIVPTSWEVFPNAVSATLQYVSLEWPTENGWVNYNSLQQLAYFVTVFLAAPLAIATGVRMSGIWPKNAKALSRAYPVEWARAVHFPVMIYFVLFIFVHVVLVFATGALRNLNHMYASTDAINWVGFWIFTASILVIAVAWIAARPLVLAPIARLFGKVSGR